MMQTRLSDILALAICVAGLAVFVWTYHAQHRAPPADEVPVVARVH